MGVETLSVPLTPQDELRHLRVGSSPSEVLGGLGSYRLTARCPDGAAQTLDRCREVLGTVLDAGSTPWPPDSEWLTLLPAWFVVRCKPEPTQEDAQRFQEWWAGASYEERFPPNAPPPEWTARGWIHSLRPERRTWWWWDASTPEHGTLLVDIGINGWPFGSGNLEWLLRASGAALVQSEEELEELAGQE